MALSKEKRKLLIILGAGSSLPCGIPGVADLDAKMAEWSENWESRPTFPKGAAGRGVFNDLWRFAEKYFAKNPRPQLGLRVNFEYILGEMISLASWVSPSPFGNVLTQVVRDATPIDDFTWPKDETRQHYYLPKPKPVGKLPLKRS